MASNYPFVTKLYSMLTELENNAFISWSPDGGAFFVWNPTEFSATVLPKYFKHNNFCSFVRQLNIYGFHKFTHDEKLFQRDSPDTIAKIQRRRQNKRSGANADESEDYIAHMPPTKRNHDCPAFVAPVQQQTVATPAQQQQQQPILHATKPSPHHMPHMSPYPQSHSSTPRTPATPAQTQNQQHSLSASTSGFTAMMSPSSSLSNSSTIEDDVAYLKTMNGMLVSELSQMKRKTASQEDTINWLIQELARTQRHVELMSNGSISSSAATDAQIQQQGQQQQRPITTPIDLTNHASHPHIKMKSEMDATSVMTPGVFTPNNNSGLMYTSAQTPNGGFQFDPSGSNNTSQLPTDYSDPFQSYQTTDTYFTEDNTLM